MLSVIKSSILKNSYFTEILLSWYPHYRRDLPWRNIRDPYIIWLSEIILQQTRVAQGLPYFLAFAERYPNVYSLASAPIEEVLRLWQGLGYYSRARNLHYCAQEVVNLYGGKFPDNYAGLLRLKGVGSYTAAAIASFAYEEPVAVVDGNVFRVLSRFFGVETDIASPAGKKLFQELANSLIPADQAGTYNQAIMEFGSLQCTPKNPDCNNCPLALGCVALKEGRVAELPVKINKVKVKTRYFLYLHICVGDKLVVNKRQSGDIWEGLYDFPAILSDSPLEPSVNHPLLEEFSHFGNKGIFHPEQEFKHLLTHQRIFANFVKFVINEDQEDQLSVWCMNRDYRLVDLETFESLPKPRLILRYLEEGL
jgi:A/G-specific adenine glycosylase